ncbi:site-specific integrase [Pseudomonas sp. TCU-HL1]|uniref:site-specific integrase n=1 Tax=Pseudomonas sp. TCU-HL1 TaxID=1856685 RepID=UPI0008574890|nr:site-specific integrase [Pseudomonas sp. TCU-HL1]AOE88103.1 hypothetical protein THL1_5556 [Pseudomonas sp. TCU-HL1]
MAYNPWFEIVWVYDTDFEGRQFPLVYLANGLPGYVINQFIYDLLLRNTGHSKLELIVRSLCHLYAFTCAKYGTRHLSESESANLIADFIDAKEFGTDKYCIKRGERYDWLRYLGLNWEPLAHSSSAKKSTLMGYLRAITEFDRWQSAFHNTARLSPTEEVFLSAWQRFQDFKNREKWDMLIHLNNARSNKREIPDESIASKFKSNQKGNNYRSCPKAFPPHRIIELVENATTNPRDKLIILIMLGGSLRRAEPLHLFRDDVEGMDIMGQARIRLADPNTGMCEWADENGRNVCGTRAEYFEKHWRIVNSDLPRSHYFRNLAPRSELDRRNQGLHAGFKGMTFSAAEQVNPFLNTEFYQYDKNYVWWCDPRIGAYWYKLFEEYRKKYLNRNPYTNEFISLRHPWLFIKIENSAEYGMPLTISALKSVWRKIKKKLDINQRLSWHSLRHFFGYYCASVLNLTLEQTQVLMHHADITSTEIYYSPSGDRIRQAIVAAYLKTSESSKINSSPIFARVASIVFPPHWTNDQHEAWLYTCQMRSALDN